MEVKHFIILKQTPKKFQHISKRKKEHILLQIFSLKGIFLIIAHNIFRNGNAPDKIIGSQSASWSYNKSNYNCNNKKGQYVTLGSKDNRIYLPDCILFFYLFTLILLVLFLLITKVHRVWVAKVQNAGMILCFSKKYF